MFDRDDLRFIAFGGFYTADAIAPEQKNFDFKEIGILVFRTSWNNNHHRIFRTLGNKIFDPEESIQITVNQITHQVSLSVGVLTQFVFETSSNVKTVKELMSYFEISAVPAKIEYNYKIIIHTLDLKVQHISPFYQIVDNQISTTAPTEWYLNDYQIMKNALDIKLSLDENQTVKEINFLCKRR